MSRTPILLYLLIISSGCASISAGSRQTFAVRSNADPAEVFFNGERIGQTPLSVKVERRSESTLEVRKEGYEPITASLETDVESWFWGNIICGGTFGSSTDAATGSMWEYSPDHFYANLQPLPGAVPQQTVAAPTPTQPVPDATAQPEPPKAVYPPPDEQNQQPAAPTESTPSDQNNESTPPAAAPGQETPSDNNQSMHWKEQSRLRHFVLINYESILKDIARGQGEYLKALQQLMNVSPDQTELLLSQLRSAHQQSHSIVEFSDRVLEIYNATVAMR